MLTFRLPSGVANVTVSGGLIQASGDQPLAEDLKAFFESEFAFPVPASADSLSTADYDLVVRPIKTLDEFRIVAYRELASYIVEA